MGPVSDLVLAFLLGAVAIAAVPGDTEFPVPPEILETAEQLRAKALAGSRASEWVRGLTDRAGPRLAGSPGDREGVAWGLDTLRGLGFANVRAEKVTVRVWQRGLETGEVVSPYPQRLVLTALGGSVATPEASVV